MRGTVKWFNDAKGFGFVEGEDGVDYFAHHTNIVGQAGHRTLAQGQAVEFTTTRTAKGLQAEEVRVV